MFSCDYCGSDYDPTGGSDEVWVGEYPSNICYKCLYVYAVSFEDVLYDTKYKMTDTTLSDPLKAVLRNVEDALEVPADARNEIAKKRAAYAGKNDEPKK